MPRSLKLYLIGVVALGAVALAAATRFFEPDPSIAIRPDLLAPGMSDETQIVTGVLFWIVIALAASALPVSLPRGTQLAVSTAPILAAMALGGPAVAAWVAAIGTTEMRELRGRIPWYGTLANHAGIVIPAVVAALVYDSLLSLATGGTDVDPNNPVALFAGFAALMVAAITFFAINVALSSTLVALRTGQPPRHVFLGDFRGITSTALALAPLAWLMSQIYLIAWWASLLFALPLYTTRLAYHRFVEMREMFTQTIGALAEAVDKRDPFTSQHSRRVMLIATDIGREMGVSENDLEALEWGGLLHDVGKIGVRDSVLLKQDRLTREERMIMNAHPVLGAEIIAPVARLAPELPIIRHHHEWFNGSGYPDRLIGDEIPKLARILHVADAFEAMTAARPYRMTPLTPEQALAELRKFAGIQFDPAMVDAFVKTRWVEGVPDAGRTAEPQPIPLLGETAGRIGATTGETARTGT
jgi:putative nucleotidyltransferase with HDIG domain